MLYEVITGKHTSKPMEDIVKEAEALVAEGVKEVILIAQELSYYGIDIYKQRMLAPLMEKLANINGLKWLRIHYTYPAAFPLEVLDVMAVITSYSIHYTKLYEVKQKMK